MVMRQVALLSKSMKEMVGIEWNQRIVVRKYHGTAIDAKRVHLHEIDYEDNTGEIWPVDVMTDVEADGWKFFLEHILCMFLRRNGPKNSLMRV